MDKVIYVCFLLVFKILGIYFNEGFLSFYYLYIIIEKISLLIYNLVVKIRENDSYFFSE